MSTPTWAAVDDDTADLLSVLADDGTQPVDREWELYVECLRDIAAATGGGVICPNELREYLGGRIKPQRIGPFARRAIREGIAAYTGEWKPTKGSGSGNDGRPARVMRLLT